MAPKRGRPRRTTRARTANGFPAGRRKSRRSKTSSGSEPTSAFEALMQVSSAELKRLNTATAADNRSDSSSKSAEENRNLLSSPSDVTLPSWYGTSTPPSRPVKTELILPPKKKKYLHYLAEADDDNKIINDPFSQPESYKNKPQWTAFGQEATPAAAGSTSELKFNPTPETSVTDPGKTLSDVLEEHISRLIVQNDHIVAKSSPTVSKRGKSRETEGIRPGMSADSSMVKNLLSSKLNRKTLAKEIAEQRPTAMTPGFSYLNPENSAIKDLLIKTYEEKGMLVGSSSQGPVEAGRLTAVSVRKGGMGFLYQVASDPRSGTLVVAGSAEGSWAVLQGNEWVFVDERGRKRVRPEVTLVPETVAHGLATTVPRSPSVESVVSSESLPSSISHNGSYSTGNLRRTVQTNGTFQPCPAHAPEDRKEMPPPVRNSGPLASTVKTLGTFHPDKERRGSVVPSLPVLPAGRPDDGHEKTLNALRGHLNKAMAHALPPTTTVPPAEAASVLPLKKRKSFHVPKEEEVAVAPPVETVIKTEEPVVKKPTVQRSQANHSATTTTTTVSAAPPPARLDTGGVPSSSSLGQTVNYAGYATYVNENHASHLNFYADLSRQYSSNLAFNRMLLQQGHSLASFRYSCVPTTTIRAARPIHLPIGERVSMYQDAWSTSPPHVNPIIHVDSSVYGKKKMDSVYYSSALKKSLHVGPTSVEVYNHKNQLIRRGLNSFLPAESLRLTYLERPPMQAPVPDEQPSTSAVRYEPRTVPTQISVEDVSDEEDNGETCSKCRRKFTVQSKKKTSKKDMVCPQCIEKSRVENAGKKRGSVVQMPRPLEAPGVTEVDSVKQAEKQLVQQRIQQMLMSHQQPPAAVAIGSPLLLMNLPGDAGRSPPQPLPSPGDLNAMDLSVRLRKSPPLETTPADWRMVEGPPLGSSKLPCATCGKVFATEGQLVLHGRVHDAGKVDKKSRGKRERSVSPQGKDGHSSNPRPFFCSECNVGFRIHGHLQKHLRSKTHITQLECAGRLQCGFYAELERQNLVASLHQMIDTADCAKALASLHSLCKSLLPLEAAAGAPLLDKE
ncbi:uncharacterized protein LOC129593440 [Paramacrobiotus metropolitanus]|uniref:uncharacterized protein LOC129593440 n=1 Tax=Paramacrobiotus metropolitanus TaxID=2943436 RepID=UPI00244652E4|nr:uncharacterized protein LOC129593440 [Paramacrobiotus metropolitanus]XP_055345730.1 uncharacterized protein LOC129593440 [Paramacrobiotus metropolitanus]XP_055345731.1 uncharacterized protein LOC129593440 [Paramacrobiotus metropolitanus]XP_055345732.1 uncharacterized protein LOC129593440 [Paramacrobiotus metropolitanus]XP_055345733.1 uncharacterized protein LOC129593440 [Paramacrobiotus metropolitanus]